MFTMVFINGQLFLSLIIVVNVLQYACTKLLNAKWPPLPQRSIMYNSSFSGDFRFVSADSLGKGIYAHKEILAIRSPVFYEMFYGESATKSSYMWEYDFNEETVSAFLRFIYKDECPRNIETVLGVLAVTNKYEVPSFQTACKNNLEFKTPWPAFMVIEKFLELEAEEMIESWWPRIESRIDDVLYSEYFLKIKQRTLIAFLERDTLCYPEVNLFSAAILWSRYQCKIQGMWVTPENQRKVLGDSIFRIRYVSMTEIDFNTYVVPTGVLTDDEVNAIVETIWYGAGQHNYDWALPVRTKREWFCGYFSKKQFMKSVVAVVALVLLFAVLAIQQRKQQQQQHNHEQQQQEQQ